MGLPEKIILFNRNHRFLSHLCFWVAILVLSLADDQYQYRDDWSFRVDLIYYCLNLITQVLTAYFLAYFILPRFFRTRQYGLVFLYFVLGNYVICAMARLINIFIREPMVGIPPKDFETVAEILTNVIKLFYIYFFRNISVALVFLFVKLMIDHYGVQKRTLLLEAEKTGAELKLLKAQLHPHFLFNTLNNIYALSMLSSPATSPSIARLGEMLDYILYRCNGRYVSLSGELTLMSNYIELEKLRYDDRLHVRVSENIDRDIDIAPLVLLSLVENAFKHGMADDSGALLIDIATTVHGPLFTFTISNSAGPVSPAGGPDPIGLVNLRKQLGLLYGDRCRMDIRPSLDRFTVTLVVDLEQNETSVWKRSGAYW